MKNGGIVRRLDDLGRVVVPKEIRSILNLKEGDPLEIFLDSDTKQIIMTEYNRKPDYEAMWKELKNRKAASEEEIEFIESVYGN